MSEQNPHPRSEIEHVMTRGVGSPLELQNVFVGRRQEYEVFQRSLDAVRSESGNVRRALEVERSAENVLAFFGIAGIGKSSLSKQLELEVRAGRFSPEGHARVTSRVNFERGHGNELEDALLNLRVALAEHPGPWEAFDIGLRIYWERAHPGEELRVALERRVGRIVEKSGVTSQMDQAISRAIAAIDELAGSFTSVTFARKATKLLADPLIRGIRERRILAENPYVRPLVEETDPFQLLSFLPALLAWDLALAQRQQAIDVVVFLDTWEEVTRGPVERGSLEDLFCRFAFLMPGVLFVITGRDALKWGEEERAHTLLYGGPGRWPKLVEGEGEEPRQHRLDRLSPEDSMRYVRSRLTIDGEAAIADGIAREIVGESGGWPEHLRLAVERFQQLVSLGDDPRPERFGTYPELVARVMRDLEEDERELLRASALVRAFDAEILLAATGGRIRRPLIRRFSARLFIDRLNRTWPPYLLHPAFADTVRRADAGLEDSWRPEDWRLAAGNVLKYLEALAADPSQALPPRVELPSIFSMIVDLTQEFELSSDVLPELAVRLGEAGNVQALRALPEPPAQSAAELRVLFDCTRALWVGPSFDADAVLRDLGKWESANLGDDYMGLLLEALGATSMAAGHLRRAEEAYGRMTAGTAPFDHRGRHGLAGIAWRKAKLEKASSGLATIDFRRGLIHPAAVPDLAGLIRLGNGDFGLAEEEFATAQRNAEEHGSALWRARASRHRAIAMAWAGADETDAQIAVARLANIGIDHDVGTAQCHLAESVVAARGGADATSMRLTEQAREVLARAGAHYDEMMACAVEAFVHLRAGRRSNAKESYETAIDRGQGEALLYPAVIEMWLDLDPAPALETVEWIGERGAAMKRWEEALSR